MGNTHGTAGGSLTNAGWASSAAAAMQGQLGERATASLLRRQPKSRVVMHDLRMPIPGMNLNIDHVVIAGRTVALVDSKRWLPGFYLTLSGRTFRGLHRTSHVDKQTMVMARESIAAYLLRRGIKAQLPAVVGVWPSNNSKKLRLWAASVPGADLIRADRLPGWLDRVLPDDPADPALVAALTALVR